MSGKLFLLKFVARQLDLGRSIGAPVTGVLLIFSPKKAIVVRQL